MSSSNNFSVFTEVYAHQLSNAEVRNPIYMKIKMIYNGKRNLKTWKTVTHCKDCKIDKCSRFLQGWYMCLLICRSKNFSLVK